MLTAFEPFGGRARNFSASILERVDHPRITRRLLPVAFDDLAGEVAEVIAQAPRALVLMGETRETDRVRVEQVALNIIDTGARPDNRGRVLTNAPVVPGGPLARAATWRADIAVRVLRERGIPAEISYHAGSYACNQALYLALGQAQARGLDIPIGFLHVPGNARWQDAQARTIAVALPALFGALVDAPTAARAEPEA